MCIPHNIYGYKQASQGAMADFMIYPAGSIVHKVNNGLDSVAPSCCFSLKYHYRSRKASTRFTHASWSLSLAPCTPSNWPR